LPEPEKPVLNYRSSNSVEGSPPWLKYFILGICALAVVACVGFFWSLPDLNQFPVPSDPPPPWPTASPYSPATKPVPAAGDEGN
jgi:hypothetical protein